MGLWEYWSLDRYREAVRNLEAIQRGERKFAEEPKVKGLKVTCTYPVCSCTGYCKQVLNP